MSSRSYPPPFCFEPEPDQNGGLTARLTPRKRNTASSCGRREKTWKTNRCILAWPWTYTRKRSWLTWIDVGAEWQTYCPRNHIEIYCVHTSSYYVALRLKLNWIVVTARAGHTTSFLFWGMMHKRAAAAKINAKQIFQVRRNCHLHAHVPKYARMDRVNYLPSPL